MLTVRGAAIAFYGSGHSAPQEAPLRRIPAILHGVLLKFVFDNLTVRCCVDFYFLSVILQRGLVERKIVRYATLLYRSVKKKKNVESLEETVSRFPLGFLTVNDPYAFLLPGMVVCSRFYLLYA